ncbi:MAG TPA: peptidoglycan bridge formation glycyltransferase FemA/FemB family protein [Patescibacteria group bacterium]
MIIADILPEQAKEFNTIVTHPLQSYEWGEFRKKTGIKVIRKGFFENKKLLFAFQLTIHPIPHTSFTIGYLPKGTMPTKEVLEELRKIADKEKCIFIQLEPNIKVKDVSKNEFINLGLIPSAHPLFTKYTFQLDLTKSEEELLKQMHPKTRYNIKIAQKHAVEVKEEDSKEAFDSYLKLTMETTNRQGFYAHTPKYHILMWETLHNTRNQLQAHLFVARFNNIPLTTWILFTFKDMLYYPYGASSSMHREVMASNVMMWEAIKFGKKQKLKLFDMWGSLGENPDTKDPWFGFHRFKLGYGPTLVEFVGSFDLVINPVVYTVYKIADKFRYLLLAARR